MINVGIVGSTGLVGETLIKVILGHREARISFLGSHSSAGRPIQEVLPALAGSIDLICERVETDRLIESCDVVILASKSPEVMALVPPLLAADLKVIDIGGEFRLKSAALYEKWYGTDHLCPELLARAVYGLPELNRKQIRKAALVANPGCYAATAILGIAPLLGAGALNGLPIPVDAFSGLSGAGRTFGGSNLFVQCNENVAGYKLGQHRHGPEIEQALAQVGGGEQRVIFLPHVVPIDRGIYCTSFAETRLRLKQEEVLGILHERFDREPFVRVWNDPVRVTVQHVRDTNFCDISAYVDSESNKVMLFSATDNMIKGAAGLAIQNLNLMFGLAETEGLSNRKMY